MSEYALRSTKEIDMRTDTIHLKTVKSVKIIHKDHFESKRVFIFNHL
jgi:hypothetical protein